MEEVYLVIIEKIIGTESGNIEDLAISTEIIDSIVFAKKDNAQEFIDNMKDEVAVLAQFEEMAKNIEEPYSSEQVMDEAIKYVNKHYSFNLYELPFVG